MKNATSKPRSFRVGRSNTGLGLFANQEIAKGDFIVEYVGPRLTNEEADQRSHSRYLFELNNRWTIDGSPRSNKARYINHSCRPNAEAYITRGAIKIRARKRIPAGAEITYNYGKAHFNEFIKDKGCRCEACQEKSLRKKFDAKKLNGAKLNGRHKP